MNFQCMKPGCGTAVKSEDTYCSSCNEAKKQIAAEMDKKFNTVGQKPNDIFAGSKEMNSAHGGKANFFSANFSAKQLGL